MIGAAGRSSQTNDGHDMVHYAETYTGSRRHAYNASREDQRRPLGHLQRRLISDQGRGRPASCDPSTSGARARPDRRAHRMRSQRRLIVGAEVAVEQRRRRDRIVADEFAGARRKGGDRNRWRRWDRPGNRSIARPRGSGGHRRPRLGVPPSCSTAASSCKQECGYGRRARSEWNNAELRAAVWEVFP